MAPATEAGQGGRIPAVPDLSPVRSQRAVQATEAPIVSETAQKVTQPLTEADADESRLLPESPYDADEKAAEQALHETFALAWALIVILGIAGWILADAGKIVEALTESRDIVQSEVSE